MKTLSKDATFTNTEYTPPQPFLPVVFTEQYMYFPYWGSFIAFIHIYFSIYVECSKDKWVSA